MPFDRQSLLISFQHVILDTDEIAQTSFHLSEDSDFSATAALEQYIGDEAWETLETVYVAFLGACGAYWADYSRFASIRAAAIATDGSTIGDASVESTTTPWTGSAGNIIPQASVVLSLRSGLTGGSGNRGRAYIPHTQLPLPSGDPWAGSGATGDFADAGAALIGDLNSLGLSWPQPPTVRIMSSLGSGTARAVAEVRCGNVTDIQRRRRNGLPETYSSTAVA